MDKAKFYAALRSRKVSAFGTSLSQKQVDGIEAVLAACVEAGADLHQAAYCLATGHGETGGRFQPVRENLNYTSASRIAAVWPTRFTVSSARAYVRNPPKLANKVYNGRMGNRPGSDDGWVMRGTGMGQITGRDNMTKWAKRFGVDPAQIGDMLMDVEFSAKALVFGLIEGLATGKKLPDYVNDSTQNYLGARAVWGGVEASKYAALAEQFEYALKQGVWVKSKPKTKLKDPLAELLALLRRAVEIVLNMKG